MYTEPEMLFAFMLGGFLALVISGLKCFNCDNRLKDHCGYDKCQERDV